MTEIRGSDPGPISPRDQKLYEKEYKQGASLFEKALEQNAKTQYAPKKEQFNDVMHRAMQVLNEAARGLKNEDLMQQNKQIEHDYKAYQKHPNDENLTALKQDLEKAKGYFEQ